MRLYEYNIRVLKFYNNEIYLVVTRTLSQDRDRKICSRKVFYIARPSHRLRQGNPKRVLEGMDREITSLKGFEVNDEVEQQEISKVEVPHKVITAK